MKKQDKIIIEENFLNSNKEKRKKKFNELFVIVIKRNEEGRIA